MAYANESLAERVDALIEAYEALNARADALINEHIDSIACPGISIAVIRQCEIDMGARGYPHDIALRVLRQRLGTS